jgi:hypothetical protein
MERSDDIGIATGRAGPRRAVAAWSAALAGAVLAGCAAAPEADVVVTRLSPAQSLICAEAVLSQAPVGAELYPAPGGWRLDLAMLTAAPEGWLKKGSLVHDGRVLAWLPESSTQGLGDAAADAAVAPVLDLCR